MNNNNYTPPEFKREDFHCPFCSVYAYQSWCVLEKNSYWALLDEYKKSYQSSTCYNCKRNAIWDSKGKMIYPLVSSALPPSENMPKNVEKIYEEARQVQQFSPRASAALLRVALEELTKHLGETKGKLNTRIKNLKEKGLPYSVIKSLDIVRINANEGGSHAGVIDLEGKDNQKIVNRLFFLVNFIVEKTITEQKEIDDQFVNLPEDKKAGIENRDS